MFDAARLPSDAEVNAIEFTTADPAISGRCHWATIDQQLESMEPSTIKLDRRGSRITGKTTNVAAVSFDVAAMGSRLSEVELDGQTLKVPGTPDTTAPIVLCQHEGKWTCVPELDPGQKSAHRGGPFKQAFAHHLLAVYGTHGSAEQNAAAGAAPRHFAEDLYYRGNGAIDLVPDVAFDAEATKDRNVLLFGNADVNAAWPRVLGPGCPIDIHNGRATVGDRHVDGSDLASLFVYPRAGSVSALVGVIASTGPAGERLAERLPLLVSGVAYPDWIVVHATALQSGDEAIAAAGFFANDWSIDSKQSAWNEKR
jgi:hypothetical protein